MSCRFKGNSDVREERLAVTHARAEAPPAAAQGSQYSLAGRLSNNLESAPLPLEVRTRSLGPPPLPPPLFARSRNFHYPRPHHLPPWGETLCRSLLLSLGCATWIVTKCFLSPQNDLWLGTMGENISLIQFFIARVTDQCKPILF